MNIISLNSNNNSSPFDSIRKVDETGNEYWTARELMPMLGYSKWQFFTEAVDRAQASCKNSGQAAESHFTPFRNLVKRPQGGGSKQEDYKLSRYACYLVAMNGDPRKPEIAAAQAYFVTKTREAEIIIPAQTEHIQELELQNEALRLQLDLAKAKKKLVDAETAQMQFRHTIALTCSEPVQQKILGYQTIERIEYRDRLIDSGKILRDGSTINKTELCHRYNFLTRNGKPDYVKLNQYLATIPDEGFDDVPAIRENRELKREYLEVLDREVCGNDRQLFLGEWLN